MRSLFSKNSNNAQSSSRKPPGDVNSNMTIARLISSHEWQILEQILSDGTAKSRITIDDPCIPHAVTEEIVIHFAARFQAPLRTISFLSKLYPISLERPDASGRFPIHVAAKWGATPDVIQFLISSNPTAAGIQDDMGKTPMHYVGECYARNYDRNNNYPVKDSMLQVVQLLKTAAPKSVNLEDNDGANAIEYALDSGADLKVIRSMQRACRDDWRKMKEQGHGKKHEDLANDLARIAVELQREMSMRMNTAMSSASSQSSSEQEKSLDGPLRLHIHRSTSKRNSMTSRAA